MDYTLSAVVYLGWFMEWVGLELAGLLLGPTGVWKPGLVPWATLSELAWYSEYRWHFMAFVFLFGLAFLMVHIVGRWNG